MSPEEAANLTAFYPSPAETESKVPRKRHTPHYPGRGGTEKAGS